MCDTSIQHHRPQQPSRARSSATACQIITNRIQLFARMETYFWAPWINTLQLPQMFTPTERQLPSFSSSSLDKVLIAVILTETRFSKRCQSELNGAAFPSIYLFIYLFVYPYLSVLFSLVVLGDELLAFRLLFKIKSIKFLKKYIYLVVISESYLCTSSLSLIALLSFVLRGHVVSLSCQSGTRHVTVLSFPSQLTWSLMNGSLISPLSGASCFI